MLPFGRWSFRVRIDALGMTGGCANPGDAECPVENDAGSLAYPTVPNAFGWVGTLTRASGSWRFVLNDSPISGWVPTSVPLTWDATQRYYRGEASTNCGPGFTCTFHYLVTFWPILWAGEQPVKRKIEELDPDEDKVWQWDNQSANLPGSTKRLIHNGGKLWQTGHTRGVCKAWGGWGKPLVTDNYVWFYP